jgi:aminopeptidase N
MLHRQIAANGYETTDDALARRAAYERAYRATADDPTPEIAHVELALDLFPDERRFRVRGHYRLRNRARAAIASVPVAIRRGVRLHALTLDGRAPASVDAAHGRHVFEATLAPGAEAPLAFDVEVDRRGAAAGVVHDILPNGTLIVGPTVLPAIGYQAGTEIGDASERRRLGLPERGPERVRAPDRATFEFVVTTPADQAAVAPGVVREVTESGGRRTTRTRVERPTSPHLFVAAARYEVARARAGGVEVEVLHHPAHASNVPRVLEAATRSLEMFSARFGAYPYPQLRIAEVPAYDERFGGFALPGVVYFTEDRGFLTDLRDERRVDIVTKRTAHEVAHQWWGHQVTPATAPGASAIVETLARYSELLVLKERHGEAALRPVLQEELRRYLSGRTGEAEVPLIEVGDQAYLYYAKGALAMMALRDVAGEARVDGALRALVEQAKAADVPDAADLVEHLRAVTPPDHHALLDEWWSRIVLYDLRVVSATAVPESGGRYRVSARIQASRAEVNGRSETPLPMVGAVDVAVHAQHPDRSDAPPLHVERVRLGASTEVAFEVAGTPGYVAVDPWVRRLDRNPDDNVRAVELR